MTIHPDPLYHRLFLSRIHYRLTAIHYRSRLQQSWYVERKRGISIERSLPFSVHPYMVICIHRRKQTDTFHLGEESSAWNVFLYQPVPPFHDLWNSSFTRFGKGTNMILIIAMAKFSILQSWGRSGFAIRIVERRIFSSGYTVTQISTPSQRGENTIIDGSFFILSVE